MRFIHTADWHIGMLAAHVANVGAARKVRQARLDSAARVVALAGEHRADFILAAGDMFEDNGVDRLLVQKTADILAASAVPVFVIPGNHDPLTSGSVWEHPAWGRAGNIKVIRQAQPVELPGGGVLLPCPLAGLHGKDDPTEWFSRCDAGGIRVGLAHGSIINSNQTDPDFPISPDCPVKNRLDYLALGHYHSAEFYAGSDGATRTAYSGAHETMAFGERNSGNALLVRIDRPGAIPDIEAIRTGCLNWRIIEFRAVHDGDLPRLLADIEAIDRPKNVLIDLRLSGIMRQEESRIVRHLGQVLESRFLCARLDVSALKPIADHDAFIRSLPAGAIRQAAERLLEWSNPDFAGQRQPDARSNIAAAALRELLAAAEEEA
ncbi:MAG: DNA repair exonuclease [Planctomycetes bacterium]|nr:DNA repair exonuclease [Planctomycetota bacterium]